MADPVTLTLAVLVVASVATGGTKTGRAATARAVRAGYQATGWRTPGKALPHHAGRAGALTGRAVAATARTTRRLATRAGIATRRGAARAAKATGRATAHAARAGTADLAGRWADRAARGGRTPRPPIVWPTRSTSDDIRAAPDVRGSAVPDGGAGSAEPDKYRVSALPEGHPDQRHYALTVEQRGGGMWAVCRGPEVLTRDGDWEPEPSPSSRDEAFLARARYSRDDAFAAATREAPLMVTNGRTAADILARDAANAATGAPQIGPVAKPPNTGAAASDAGDPPTAPPDTAPPSGTTPHARARAERSTPVRNRYTINLEMPGSDAEFLESCVHLGDVLKAIAEEISEWAGDLHALSLPTSVIQPLDSIAEGLTEAASGAAQAAKSFEDEFEDARGVASRGMTITGQDAA